MFATVKLMTFSLFLVFPRLRKEFLFHKTCQIDVLSMPCSNRSYSDGTSGNNLPVHKDKICGRQDNYNFSQENSKIKSD